MTTFTFKKITVPIKELLRKKSLRRVFIALTALNKIYFDAYLKPDFLERKTYYAKQFIRVRQKFFRALQKMRSKNQAHPVLVESVVRIYETIFSLHLLRFRVTDFTIFAICRQDMQSICDLMTELLQNVQHHLSTPALPKNYHLRGNDSYLDRTKSRQCEKPSEWISAFRGTKEMMPIATDRLLAAIHIFETIYQQTLTILSPDPSIFLFFIQDCYTLCDDIENMSNLLWQA